MPGFNTVTNDAEINKKRPWQRRHGLFLLRTEGHDASCPCRYVAAGLKASQNKKTTLDILFILLFLKSHVKIIRPIRLILTFFERHSTRCREIKITASEEITNRATRLYPSICLRLSDHNQDRPALHDTRIRLALAPGRHRTQPLR